MRRILLAAILLASAGYADAAPKSDSVANATPKRDGVAKAAPKSDSVAKAAPKSDSVAKVAPKGDSVAKATPKGDRVAKAATKGDRVAKAAPKGDRVADAEPKSDKVAKATPKSGGVGLALDEVRTLTFKDPIATVYVGNPSIADVTMIDARHAFVQGKSYGHTNIVALDKENTQVFDTYVSVSGGAGGGTVTLNRGAQRITLSCAGGRCEPAPTPGDDQKSYDAENTQLNNHQAAAHNMAVADSKPAN
jgi:Flp pilus assembly secretin CpaC